MTMSIGGQQVPLQLQPDVLLLCVGLLFGYFVLARRQGPVLVGGDEPPVSRRQATFFSLGVAALWVASGSPLHTLADGYLFSAHMVQHLLQAFVVAPLLLLGIPGWMFELLTANPTVRRTLRMLGGPLVAGLSFNLVLMLIHWPGVVRGMVESGVFHGTMHVLLVTTSLLMWLPLLSPSEAVVHRLNPLPRLGYLFAMTILPTVPASFLTFGDPASPVYPVYAQFPRLWDLPVGEDMLIAGLIMKIGGGFLLWGIIAVMFFRWAAAQERADQAERRTPRPPRPPVDATPSTS